MKLKHIAACTLISLGLLSFNSTAFAKQKVMTTFTVLYDITKNIAGDKLEVESLTKPGADIHEYEPTSKDLVRLNRSNLIITNGLNLEIWFSRFYTKLSKKIPVVVATQGITPINIVGGPYNGKPNPHAWMSVTNAQYYVQNIRDALIKLDPANKAAYEANAAKYLSQVKTIEQQAIDFFNKNRITNYLITSESAFSYLSKDFNFKYDSIWPVNSDVTGSPAQIKRIVDLVKKEKIPVLFSGSTMDPKPMETIAKETGAKFAGYLYVDSLTDAKGPVPTYLDMLSKSVQSIVDGFASAKK